jgi:hypothetical protein
MPQVGRMEFALQGQGCNAQRSLPRLGRVIVSGAVRWRSSGVPGHRGLRRTSARCRGSLPGLSLNTLR